MTRTYRQYAVLDDSETEIEVEVAVYGWGRPAQTYGPPENCYPAEDPEAEIIAAWLVEDAEPRPDILSSLTEGERQRIVGEFFETYEGVGE